MTASDMRDLYKFHGHYARLTPRVQRKVRLVVHGQNGSAVLHVDHALAISRGLRHVVDNAIGKISSSEIAPKTKAKDQDRRDAQGQVTNSRLVHEVLALVVVNKLVLSACRGWLAAWLGRVAGLGRLSACLGR
jgi:hypothetical protein